MNSWRNSLLPDRLRHPAALAEPSPIIRVVHQRPTAYLATRVQRRWRRRVAASLRNGHFACLLRQAPVASVGAERPFPLNPFRITLHLPYPLRIGVLPALELRPPPFHSCSCSHLLHLTSPTSFCVPPLLLRFPSPLPLQFQVIRTELSARRLRPLRIRGIPSPPVLRHTGRTALPLPTAPSVPIPEFLALVALDLYGPVCSRIASHRRCPSPVCGAGRTGFRPPLRPFTAAI